MVSNQLSADSVESVAAASRDTVAAVKRRSPLRSRLVIIGGTITACFIVTAIIGPYLAPYHPLEPDLVNRLTPPGPGHLLGTDYLGRDQLSRILHGSRLSLIIGLAVGFGALVVGSAIGLISGFRGGWLDHALMRVMDVFLAFPGVLIAVAIVAALGPAMPNLVAALTINAVPIFARVARASTLAIRSRAFPSLSTLREALSRL